MIRLFAGYDAREAMGFHVFVASVLGRTTPPLVAIGAIGAGANAGGSNAFTYARFTVPAMCGYSGHAIFCDASDMLMLGDVSELESLFDPRFAVQVVKHPPYKTRHRVKYCGTSMECPNVDYPRKNWASVMLMNCAHPAWRALEGAIVGRALLQFDWLDDALIGALPDEWNRLVDEGQPVDGAKVLHWTAGSPGFPYYQRAPGADHWHEQYARMREGVAA